MLIILPLLISLSLLLLVSAVVVGAAVVVTAVVGDVVVAVFLHAAMGAVKHVLNLNCSMYLYF